MKHLSFCPECGKESLQFDAKNKIFCPDCGFSLYHNTAAAVAVVILQGEKLLLTRRNQNPGKGKLDLPGGFSDPYETAEETCARELEEELGIKIDPSKLRYCGSLPNTYPYNGIDYFTMDLFFEYTAEEEILPQQVEAREIAEIVWVHRDELHTEDLAFSSQKKFFEEYYLKTPRGETH